MTRIVEHQLESLWPREHDPSAHEKGNLRWEKRDTTR